MVLPSWGQSWHPPTAETLSLVFMPGTRASELFQELRLSSRTSIEAKNTGGESICKDVAADTNNKAKEGRV